MAAHATLRFEPVTCVLSIVEDADTEPTILDISTGRAERITAAGAEHFADLHGAVLYVGPCAPQRSGVAAAGILELPSGRHRLAGEARFTRRGESVDLVMRAVDGSGTPVIVRATCRTVDVGTVLTTPRRREI